MTAAVSTSNTHVPSESGTYHRMAADIEYEVTVVRGHRGGPVHAAPVTLRGSDTVRGGMQFLATPEQLRHSGQLTGLAGIDRQDDRPQDIPLPDRFRTHGIAGLATVLEVTPLTAPLPAPQPPGTEAPATQPATAPANEPAQQQPGPDPRDFLRTRLTELISTETPGALTPGSSHYVPGLRQRIADFTSPAAMAALVGRGGDQPLAFTFPYPDGLTTKNVTVRLSGRTGWDATALENARGRAAAAGAGLETFSQHAPNNITDARSTTTKWGASGSGSASVPTAATGSRKLGVSPGAAHSTTRTDTVTTTTTAEDRIWQRTDGGAEFKLAWTFNAEISVDGVNRGAIPEVNASVTLRFAHDNAPAAAGPVIERLPAGVQEQDPRTGLTRAEATPVRPSGTEVVYGAPQSLPLLNAIHAVAPSLVDAEGLISGTSQEAAAVRITELLHGGEITVDPLRQASGLGGPPVHTADGNPRTTLSTEILRPKLLGDSHGVTIDRVRQTGFGITAGSSTSRTTNATLGVNHTVDTEGNHTLGASTSPFHYQSVPQGQGGGDSAAGRRWTKVGSAGQRTATSGLHTHEIEADSVTTVTGPDGTRHVTGTVVLRVSELDLLGLGVLPDADRGDGVWDLSAPPRRPDNVSDPGPGNPGTRPDAVIVEHLVRAREEQENVLDTDRRMPQLWTTLPHGDRNDPEWRAAEQQAMDRAARIARESQLTVELAVRDDDGIRYRVFDPETADAEGSRGTEIDGPGGPRSDSLAAQPLDRPTPSVATVSSSSAPPPPPPPPVRNRPEGNTETAAASPPPRDPDASRPVKPPRAEGDFVQHRVGRQELPVRGRDDTVAVSTERFDPKLRQDDRPAGRLSGSETRIRYRVSREQLPDGRTARHFFVTLPFKRGQDVSTTDLTDLQKRVQSLLDTHINRGYRLPGSGDQLMVTTGFLDKPDRSDAITLTRTPVPGRADQLHWDVNDHDAVLTHELLHYLGLPDEYLDTPGRQEGDPHIFRARQDRTGVHDDGLMAVADTASLSRVLADHLAVIERVSDTANIPLHTTSAAQPTAPSRMLAPDSTPEYPASQSNRGRGGRGGGNANRGGPPDSRGGGNANRGGPPQSRGGGNANRGGPPQSRGGGNANRGGPPDSRGGGNANRGGPPQSRGGGNANRGGPPQGRGGGNANRGGHTAHGPAAANSTAAPTTTVPYVNNHFQSRFGSATADTLNPNQYRTAVRDSVRQMRPISFVVNAMVDWNTLTREPETIDRFVQAVLQGRRSENPPEVAIVIGVNGRVNSANPGVEQNILNAIRNATTDRNWSVPVALVAVPMRLRQSDDFPYGTARNHVLTSDATSRALNGMRTTTHPYMSFMDLDPYPHLTPSGRHVFEHFENRLSFDDMTDLGYAPLRPLLISGGYTIPAATDTQGRDRLVRETLARWNTRFGDRPSDVENTIPMFDDLIRHDMRVRSRMAETAPLVPYSPEPNLFADGLAILLDIPADHQALGPVRFSRGAGEYHGLADSLMRLAAWEIANDAADGIREVGDRNRTGRTDRSELTAQVHVAADHLRPAARGTAFLVDFENGATQTDLSRLFVGMLESRRKTAEATEGGQHPDPGALHVPQSHTNPPPFGRLFTLDRTDREALKNAPPFNNAALRSSDLMNGRPLAPDPAADPLNLFADKPLKQAASVPVPGHPGLFAGLGPDQQRLHALNLLNVTDEAVLQRGFHTFATMYLSDGGEGLNTRPRSFFDALGQALSPGTSPLRTHGDGSPVTPSVAPWSAAHDGVATMLQSVITTHTDEVPQPLAVAPERTPAEQERDRAAWIRSGAQEARTLVARAQEAGMTVEDLLVRLFTGRIHPMSHNFDEYTVPVPPQQESSAAAAARRTTPLEGPFTLDGSALLLLGLYADGLGRTLVVTGPDGTTETVRPQGPSAGELRVVWTAHGWSVPEPVATSSGSTAPAPRPGAGGGGRGLDQQAFDILTGSKGSGSGKGGKR
ncbi:hypothetical protein GTW66_04050 [Streptomyces sp. SID5473]|uniref:hypothetical protein n=1 Tax=Streptomyces sp. SID5473 TaxID=2690299 RepID=UPI00025CBC15|nr:hypothetical protein [Streptomyces sp. SID5473]EIF93981.1 hypothetical protein [Streptomyces tsukubensis NRRL18488]MYS63317.1 hypothetical protein [Streptomyces sp. SID5473]